MGRSQSRMPGLSQDQEEDVPNARDAIFPGFLLEKSGSQEMAFKKADLLRSYFIVFLRFNASFLAGHMYILY